MASVAPHPHEFISCARHEFQFLVSEYGFAEVPNNLRRYFNPVSVRFENQTTLISVEGIAHGFSTTVELGEIPQPCGDLDKTIPLWPLAQLRQPVLYEAFSETLGQLNQLPLLARLLRLTANEILLGDFTMLPYIERTVDEYIAEQRRLEMDHEFRQTMQRASDAFWKVRYSEVVDLLAPHAERLTPTQAKQLNYALRHH